MNVPVKASVPIDLAQRAKNLLDRLLGLHQSDLEKLGKRAKAGSPAAAKQSAELADRGRYLTPHNVWRVAIEYGIVNLEKMKPEDVIALLSSNPIVMGRPRGTRAA